MTNKESPATNTTAKSAKRRFDIGSYFTTKVGFIIGLTAIVIAAVLLGLLIMPRGEPKHVVKAQKKEHWFVLHRKSNVEYLMKGIPGNKLKSKVVRSFKVKAGVPGKKPTPLPQLLGKKYWVITKKFDSSDNPETAPFFIELNVPSPDMVPYGPSPYLECNGQCNWELPGPFGLHGVNGDLTRLDPSNEGSSGCIRHTDEDITYLYNLIDPNEKTRYYIEDI